MSAIVRRNVTSQSPSIALALVSEVMPMPLLSVRKLPQSCMHQSDGRVHPNYIYLIPGCLPKSGEGPTIAAGDAAKPQPRLYTFLCNRRERASAPGHPHGIRHIHCYRFIQCNTYAQTGAMTDEQLSDKTVRLRATVAHNLRAHAHLGIPDSHEAYEQRDWRT
jgi:hypothetical protein